MEFCNFFFRYKTKKRKNSCKKKLAKKIGIRCYVLFHFIWIQFRVILKVAFCFISENISFLFICYSSEGISFEIFHKTVKGSISLVSFILKKQTRKSRLSFKNLDSICSHCIDKVHLPRSKCRTEKVIEYETFELDDNAARDFRIPSE